MKFSLMTYSMMPLLRDGKIKFADVVKFASEEGFEAIDLFMWDLQRPVKETKNILDKYNLGVSSITGFVDFADVKEEVYLESVDKGKYFVDKAVELESPYVMIVPAMENSINGIEDRERAVSRIISGLQEVVKYSKNKNVIVTIEDYPNLRIPLCSIDEIERILKAVDGLKLTFDDGNMMLAGDDPVEAYNRLWEYTVNVHLKEWELVEKGSGIECLDGKCVQPGMHGDGIINNEMIFKSLINKNFQGYMSFEYEATLDAREGIKKGIDHLRKVLKMVTV